MTTRTNDQGRRALQDLLILGGLWVIAGGLLRLGWELVGWMG